MGETGAAGSGRSWEGNDGCGGPIGRGETGTAEPRLRGRAESGLVLRMTAARYS